MSLAFPAFAVVSSALLFCLSYLLLPSAADEAVALGSVSNHGGGASPSSTALPPLQQSSGDSDSSVPPVDHDAAARAAHIERLLLQAEHLRYGVPEGHSPSGTGRPRPSLHSPPNHPSLAHSLAADKRADEQGAAALYKQAAALGSATALNELGEMAFYTPSGANVTAAREWWTQAADLGNPEAQHHLAVLEWLGLNEAGRSDEGVAMLFEYFAALGGNALARMSLGYRHLHGLSAPQSCDASVAYYQQVAEEVLAESVSAPLSLVVEKSRLADERSRSVAPEEGEDAIQYYQHSAENGDVQAQVGLGHVHLYGARGFERNPERAARYFRAAAGQGNAAAMAYLGQMHIQGLGVAQNNATALRFLSDAAARHNPAAQNSLGYMHLQGHGMAQDFKQALAWFKKAADQGHAEAQFNLGAMYFAGLGVDKKYATALQYFSLAGHAGYTRALYNLAQMHLHGLGTIKSCVLGVKMHKTVAERGSWATGLNDAHRHFLKGNYELAWLLYARAAEEGHEVAQANSAWMLDQGLGVGLVDTMVEVGAAGAVKPASTEVETDGSSSGGSDSNKDAASPSAAAAAPLMVNRRHILAHRHWSAAAEQGNIDSLRMLGDYAFEGLVTGVPDFAQAVKFYAQAAEHRHPQALFNLGYMYEHGFGLAEGPDFHLAKRHYDQCLEADSDAIVPVKLALAKLYVKSWWKEFNATPPPAPAQGKGTEAATEKSDASAKDQQASARSKSGRSRPLPGPLEWVMKHVRASGLSDFFARVGGANNAYELFLSVEDVLLALLCAALAIIVYVRSQR